MGLLKGNMAMTMFDVAPREGADDATVENLDKGTTFRALFTEYAWKDELPRVDGVKRGWVSPIDPTDPRDVICNPHVYTFTLREDKISINATFKKIAIRQAEQAAMEERGVDKLGRAARKDVREAVLQDLERRALPTVQLVDLAYDPSARRLYIFSTSQAQIEMASTYFAECFDVRLSPHEMVGESARDHLLWLWLGANEGSDFDGLGITVELEDRLTLAHEGTGERMVVVGENPGGSPDAGYGLRRGKLPSELRFVLNVDDHEFKVGLAATEVGINITRLGAPKAPGSSPEEVLDERLGLCLTALKALAKLEVASEKARSGDDWREDAQETLIDSLDESSGGGGWGSVAPPSPGR